MWQFVTIWMVWIVCAIRMARFVHDYYRFITINHLDSQWRWCWMMRSWALANFTASRWFVVIVWTKSILPHLLFMQECGFSMGILFRQFVWGILFGQSFRAFSSKHIPSNEFTNHSALIECGSSCSADRLIALWTPHFRLQSLEGSCKLAWGLTMRLMMRLAQRLSNDLIRNYTCA